jgi:chaperonin GroEL (HSP60 family)
MKIAAPRFLNNPARYEMVAEDCNVLVTNYNIDSIRDFADFWNALKVNKLVIFAPSFSDEVLIQMVKLISPRELPNGQMQPSGIQIFPVKCPSLGSEDTTPHNFKDLALFCGANFIDKTAGMKLKDVKEYDMGFAEKITVKSVEDREDAVILGGKGAKSDKVREQISDLKKRIELTKMPEHKAILNKRIASLASVGGIIRVGAPTEAEALPLKHKIEDAVFAGQAALKHGYVQGAGLCLKKIAEEHFADDKLIHDALCAPHNQILENLGEEKMKVGKEIIDPAKVVELVVEHGFGVAANLVTVKAIIPEFDENDPREPNKLIADAIKSYTFYWAKREGLIQSGKDESEAERNQREEYLMAREND